MLAAMTMPTGTDAQAAAAVAEGTDAIVDWWGRHHFVVGNNPGTPFSWDFVHPSQFSQWANWARAKTMSASAAEVLEKSTASETACAGLAEGGVSPTR